MTGETYKQMQKVGLASKNRSDFFPGFGFRSRVLGSGFKVSGFKFCKLLLFLKSMTMLKRGLRTL